MLFSFFMELSVFGWICFILFWILFIFIIIPLALVGLFVFFPSCFFPCLNFIIFSITAVIKIINILAYPFHVYCNGKCISNLDSCTLKRLDKLSMMTYRNYVFRQCQDWAKLHGFRFLDFYCDENTRMEYIVWYSPEQSTIMEFHQQSNNTYYIKLYTTFDNNVVLCSETKSDESYIPERSDLYRQIFMIFTLFQEQKTEEQEIMRSVELEKLERQKSQEDEYGGDEYGEDESEEDESGGDESEEDESEEDESEEDESEDEYDDDDFDDDDFDEDEYEEKYEDENGEESEYDKEENQEENYLIVLLYKRHKEAVEYLTREKKAVPAEYRIIEMEWGNKEVVNCKQRRKKIEEALKKNHKEKLSQWYICGHRKRCQERAAYIHSLRFWRLRAGLWPIFLSFQFNKSIEDQFSRLQEKNNSKEKE